MNRILIREVDQTTPAITSLTGTDVVYVPGFSSALDTSGVAVAPRVPTLCTSIRDFEAKFGATPPLFAENQYYPVQGTTTAGFPAIAIPNYSSQTQSVWFKANDPDPSYMYAKELLAAGIPVVYERFNTYPTVQSAEGETIEQKKENYDVKVTNFYQQLQQSLSSAPGTYGSASITQCITEVAINVNTFISKYSSAGNHLFEYSGTNWVDENAQNVDLSEIGITLTLTPIIEYEPNTAYEAGTYIKHTVGSVVGKYLVTNSVTAQQNTGWESMSGAVAEGTPAPVEGDTITVVLYYDDAKLLDKGQYSVKYITSGGYPTFEYNGKSISELMAEVAAIRGDAIALIDHTDNPSRALLGRDSVYAQACSQEYVLRDALQTYAAMFTPYAFYTLVASYGSAVNTTYAAFPPSFAYLISLANSISNNPSWLAIAGVARGKVANLISVDIDGILSNSIADSYQTDTGISINPITEIRPYGQCIWGNRTLFDNSKKGNTTASSFLNIRNLVCDIKKQLFLACQTLMFEQNTDVLWINFLSIVTPLLDRMVSGNGISNYKIIKEESNDRAKIVATVRIYPIYAVEGFDITVYLNDSDVNVEE